jgi:hypothetical protein
MEPRKRTVITFAAVRALGRGSLEECVEEIGAVVHCVLRKREDRGTVFFEADVLGMRIELIEWETAAGSLLFFHGFHPWATTEDSDQLDITPAIIDLLCGAQLGQWRVPTLEDYTAVAQ